MSIVSMRDGKLYWTARHEGAYLWGSNAWWRPGTGVSGAMKTRDLVVMAALEGKKIISTTNLGAAIISTPIVATGSSMCIRKAICFALYDESKSGRS